MGSKIIGDIVKNQLTWFEHNKRMNEIKWPRNVLGWVPLEKRNKIRRRKNLRDDFNELMDAKKMNDDMFYYGRKRKVRTETRQQPWIYKIYIYTITQRFPLDTFSEVKNASTSLHQGAYCSELCDLNKANRRWSCLKKKKYAM